MGTSFGLVTIETLRVKFSEIYVNGELTKKVISANDIEGWVDIIDSLSSNGEAVTHRVYGDISLVPIVSVKNINSIVDRVSIVSNSERKIVPISTSTFSTNHIYVPLTQEEAKILKLSSDLLNPSIRIEMPKVSITTQV